MPCLGPTPAEWDAERRRNGTLAGENEFEAVLCGILSTIRLRDGDDELGKWLDCVNWKEVGVPRKRVEKWWKEHQAADEERRATELREANKNKVKRDALAKLSPAERKALGL